ncbi:hypothetical protein [uncultured Tateyamaria sp.]|uniref:hypothetical protein n=1 Tax=uncultured Tateyamaria sp. TaxID=455651 RepID=UPI0026100F4B|nr:hypothetical protein [uncultured Tateyamaria sp.]
MPQDIGSASASFHIDLSDALDHEVPVLVARGKRHVLHRHDDASRAKARKALPRLAKVSDDRLTHYAADVSVPAGHVLRVHVKLTKTVVAGEVDSPDIPFLTAIIVTPAAGEAASFAIDYISTAEALAFHHPNLITGNTDAAKAITDMMQQNAVIAEGFNALGTLIRTLGRPSTTPGAGWATLVKFERPADPSVTGTAPDGTVVSYPGINSFFLNPGDAYQAQAGPVQTQLMQVAMNSPALQNIKWDVQFGTNTVPADAPDHPDPVAPSLAAQLQPLATVAVTSAADTASDDWTVAVTNGQRTDGVQMSVSDINSDAKSYTLTFTDRDLRYLGVYVQFYDAEGNTIDLTQLDPPWQPDNPDTTIKVIRAGLGDLIEYPDTQLIGYTSGVVTVLGIPTAEASVSFDITMPEGAVGAKFFGSGLGLAGSMDHPKTVIFGAAVTVIMNMVVPAVMLAGAASDLSNGPTKAEVRKQLNKDWWKAIGEAGYYFYEALTGTIADKEVDWADLIEIAKVLFDPVSLELLLFIEAEMAAEEVAEEVPFAGWILFALNLSVGIAELAETIVEVVTSPWHIPVGVVSTITSTVSVEPDPRAGGAYPYPSEAAELVVTMSYKGGKRPAVTARAEVPALNTDMLAVAFPKNTLGGQIKIEVSYYVNGWTAAQASSGWFDNNEANAAQITLALVQNPIPLDENSIYAETAQLIYQDGAYGYETVDQNPTATEAVADTGSSGNAISVWNGITLSQRYGMLGFAWKAAGMGITDCVNGTGGQLYAMQNVNIPGTKMTDAAFPSCGFTGPTRMVYDPYPPKFLMDADGNWEMTDTDPPTPTPDPNDPGLGDYFVDPRTAATPTVQGGGYHLRRIDLSTSPVTIDTSADQPSYGRFTYFPTSLTIHPSGHAIGVNDANCKLSIVPISPTGVADEDAPLATDFAGQALQDGRAGLLFRPVAVTCAYDGTVLVLESTHGSDTFVTYGALARIQAFNVAGDPVKRFHDSNGGLSPFLSLEGAGDYTYLDMCAVGDLKQTYIYVLYQTPPDPAEGVQPGDYCLAIYEYGLKAPTTNPLVVTTGASAASIFADMWHQMYSLNYAMVTDASGAPSGPGGDGTGPGGRTVPAIGQWLPPFPSTNT